MSEEFIVCHKCKNDILFAYAFGWMKDYSKNVAKALEQAKSGLGKRYKVKGNKLYSFDKDPIYNIFEVKGMNELICKCGGRIEIIKDYDKENKNQIKLTLFYRD